MYFFNITALAIIIMPYSWQFSIDRPSMVSILETWLVCMFQLSISLTKYCRVIWPVIIPRKGPRLKWSLESSEGETRGNFWESEASRKHGPFPRDITGSYYTLGRDIVNSPDLSSNALFTSNGKYDPPLHPSNHECNLIRRDRLSIDYYCFWLLHAPTLTFSDRMAYVLVWWSKMIISQNENFTNIKINIFI